MSVRPGQRARRRGAAGAVFAGLTALSFLAACGPLEPDRPPVHLTILQFNDDYILEPVDRERVGMARVATVVKTVRGESVHTVLAIVGDTISPSIMSTLLRGQQMIAAWNRLGLDVATFGNHEFDFGPAVLRMRMQESQFPWTSANVLDRATGQPFGGARPVLLLERGGARLGVVGLTLPETSETSSPGPDIVFRPTVQAAGEAVARLTAGGRPILIGLTHQTVEADEALARALPGFALIVGGHEHDPIKRIVGDTLITKAGADGVDVVRVDLQVTANGRVLGRHHRFLPITRDIAEDPPMAALVQGYTDRLTRALEVPVGETRVPLDARTSTLRTGETNLGDFVADVMRARLQADVAVMNGGGIRSNRIVPIGPLTKKDVQSLLPFLNVLVKLEITGHTLLAVLERSVSVHPRESGGSSRSQA